MVRDFRQRHICDEAPMATPVPYVPWRTPYGSRIHLDQSVATAFRDHRATLLVALTVSGIHVLANSLCSVGLISREQLEHVQLLALTPNERKVHLFDAVEARLRTNPKDFLTFLDVLNSDCNSEGLYIFANSIWTSYLRHKVRL